MKKALVALALLMASMTTSMSVRAAGLDIALSNDTANIAVLFNPYTFSKGGGSELSVGGFLNETGDNLLFASLMAHGIRNIPGQQYTLAAGVKLLTGELEVGDQFVDAVGSSESVGALGLGFKAGYVIPARQNPMELSLEGFIAPNITSFGDAEGYTEINARFQVEIIPAALTYIGYRRVEFDTNNFNDVRLDSSLHLGIKLAF